MFKKLDEKKRLWQAGEITEESFNQSLQSYLGVLKHGNCFALRQKILTNYNPTPCGVWGLSGGPDGNRTRISIFAGWYFTIKLRAHESTARYYTIKIKS